MKITRLVRWLTVAGVAVAGIASVQADGQAPVVEVKKPHWESTATASLTLTRGNSETLLASLQAKTERKWDKNELKLGADGAYGENTIRTTSAGGSTTNNTTVNVNALHGFAQYNRLFSERAFGLIRVDGMHDEIAKIDYRVVISPGLGYYFIKKPATTLSAEVGPSYVFERLNGKENSFATLRAAEGFNHQISDRAKIWQKTEVLPKLEDFSYLIVNTEVGISASITKDNKLALTSTLNHTYTSQPAESSPKRMRNDFMLKTGLTYTF